MVLIREFTSGRDLRGTLPYMAPELVSDPDHVSEKADVWSMGIVMWELVARQSASVTGRVYLAVLCRIVYTMYPAAPNAAQFAGAIRRDESPGDRGRADAGPPQAKDPRLGGGRVAHPHGGLPAAHPPRPALFPRARCFAGARQGRSRLPVHLNPPSRLEPSSPRPQEQTRKMPLYMYVTVACCATL
eukprot:scaffold313021_cov41-Prasinocladus_malaysianus.AAC.1